MQNKKIFGAILGAFFTSLAVTPEANATLITTGVIEVVTPQTGRFNFDFTIAGLSVVGRTSEGQRLLRSGYEGDTFVGDQRRFDDDMFAGHIEDQFFLWRGGTGPVGTTWHTTAAGGVLTQGQTAYYSQFEFNGSLCGLISGPSWETPCDVVFPVLTGQGIAEFLFDESILQDGRHYFTPTKATYTFRSVPEPATLALFCLGLVSIGYSKRRRLIR